MSAHPTDSEPAEMTPEVQARLTRTVSMLAAALERRRQKINAGVPVAPPPRCHCIGHKGAER